MSQPNLSRQRSRTCRRCRKPWDDLDHRRCKRPLTLKVLERRAEQALVLMRYREGKASDAQVRLDIATRAATEAFDALNAFKAARVAPPPTAASDAPVKESGEGEKGS